VQAGAARLSAPILCDLQHFCHSSTRRFRGLACYIMTR
jgi:hypothetical protein